MSSVVYNVAKEKMGEGGFDPVNDTIHCLLLDALTTTPDDPDHEFVADIVADEGADGTYSRQTLGTKTGTRNDTDDRWEFDCANIVYSSLAGGFGTVLMAIIYTLVTNDAASWLISSHDIANTLPDGTDFTLIVGANGAVHIT